MDTDTAVLEAPKKIQVRRTYRKLSFNMSLPVMARRDKTEAKENAASYTIPKMINPSAVAQFCSDLADLSQEAGIVLDLNTKMKIIDRRMIGLGAVDSCPMAPREIFRGAIENAATCIILVHNHPSGDPLPSAEDLAITKRIIDAGKIIGILVKDHVIIGRGDTPYISMLESGMMVFPTF